MRHVLLQSLGHPLNVGERHWPSVTDEGRGGGVSWQHSAGDSVWINPTSNYGNSAACYLVKQAVRDLVVVLIKHTASCRVMLVG